MNSIKEKQIANNLYKKGAGVGIAPVDASSVLS